MKKRLWSTLWLVVFSAVLISGCAPTKQARDVKLSGFLGDYTMLQKGGEGEALLNYKNPEAEWASYDKIMIDKVVILRNLAEGQEKVPQEDFQRIADNFYTFLYVALAKDYSIVYSPGPNTLRVQVALTDVEKSAPVLDTITGVLPPGLVISKGKEFITGKPAFVGEVSAEAKMTDSRSGELLAAGVDRKVGGKSLKGSTESWDDANESLDLWSKLIAYRLCQWRDGAGCVDPNK
jgi:Protein of unknown function (DUF3313)